MTRIKLSAGICHELPTDMRTALLAHPEAARAWETISAIARNEWICWTITVKQQKTRDEHVARTVSQLAEGKRRPCCWAGCLHRTDKQPGAWAKKALLHT